MKHDELQALWADDGENLPTAFTVGELQRVAEGAPGHAVETSRFLRRLLVARREGQLFRAFGLLVAIPIVVFALTQTRSALAYLLIGAGVFALGLLVWQLRSLSATQRLLWSLGEESPTLTSEPSWRGVAGLGLFAVAMTALVTVTYSGWVNKPGHMPPSMAAERKLLEMCEQGSVDACESVLASQAGHPVALAKWTQLRADAACLEQLTHAHGLVQEGFLEQALGALEKLGDECSEPMLQTAAGEASELASSVVRAARVECLSAAADGRWQHAQERCGVYARYACQGRSPEWQATDEGVLALQNAKGQLARDAGAFACPQSPVFRELNHVAEREQARSRWAERYPVELRAAVTAFGEGRLEQAKTLLAGVNSAQASALRDDLSTVQAAIAAPKNEDLLRRALKVEAGLVGHPEGSRLRSILTSTIAHDLYDEGKALADRRDWRGACRAWKRASSFQRSNIDLLKALTNVCTRQASIVFADARNCRQLELVLEFAVDGDGFKEQVEERWEVQCGEKGAVDPAPFLKQP